MTKEHSPVPIFSQIFHILPTWIRHVVGGFVGFIAIPLLIFTALLEYSGYDQMLQKWAESKLLQDRANTELTVRVQQLESKMLTQSTALRLLHNRVNALEDVADYESKH